MFEYNYGIFADEPDAASGTSVTFAGMDTNALVRPDMSAVVIRGKGLGQVRRVTAVDVATGTVTVEPPWNVTPDTSSHILVQAAFDKCVIYANTIDGKMANVTNTAHSAQVAVIAQGCHDLIVAGNLVTECRFGLYSYAFWEVRANLDIWRAPCFFHLYANNEVLASRTPIFDRFRGSGNDDDLVPPDTSIYSLGHVYRKNVVRDVVQGDQWAGAVVAFNTLVKNHLLPPIELIVLDGNEVINTKKGYVRHGGGAERKMGSVLLLRNVFERGTAPLDGSYGAASPVSAKPGSGENLYRNFAANYRASPVYAPVLELPQRVLPLYGKAGGSAHIDLLEIWNAGTAPMPWVATTDAAWLTVLPSSGTVQDEWDVGVSTVSADPSGLAAGTYTGVVTVTAGDLVRKATVHFVVAP